MRLPSGRTAPLYLLAFLSTLTGCSGDSDTTSGGATSSGSGGGSASSSGTGGEGMGGTGGEGMGGAGGEGMGGAGGGDVCQPGETKLCYTGPAGTEIVGACKAGLATCNTDGLGYGPCTGEVTPLAETCATPVDDDCDGQINEEGAACVCVPNSMVICYSGPMGTENVGACKSGTKSCNAQGTAYGPCFGEVAPVAETCLTPEDDNCDGQINEGGAGCVCLPNTLAPCYTGSPGTQDVGACKGGTKACNAQGTAYGPCIGEIIPAAETCNTVVDDDCDGQINEEGAGCVCLPNSATTCYSGSPGTAGVGICKLGTSICNAQGTAYGPCAGEVIPGVEDCMTPADENCNGIAESCGAALWSRSFGDAVEQDGLDVATDAAGNVYVTGSFLGSMDLGGGVLTSAGGSDIYIAKYSSTGTHIWSKRIGASGEQHGRGIAVDAVGNVYVTGFFASSVDFGGGVLTSAGARDIFVLKLTSAGAHIMSKRFGGLLDEEGASIAVDGASNIAVAGIFKSTIDFGGGPLTSAGGDDIFALRLNSAGNHVFSKAYGDPGNQDARDVAVDGNGNVIFIGFYEGTIDLGGGPLTANGNDIVLAKFSPAGSLIFGKSFTAGGSDIGHSVAVDGAGNIYASGYLSGQIDFGGGPVPTVGGNEPFLIKLDPAGGHIWSKTFAAVGEQLGYGIAVDTAGNVAYTGRFLNSVNFGGATLTSAGMNDIFLAKLDPSGGHLWSLSFGDGVEQIGRAVAMDSAGAVSLIGRFQGSVDFGAGVHLSAGGNDGFIAHFAP